jgi:hypothetical protein
MTQYRSNSIISRLLALLSFFDATVLFQSPSRSKSRHRTVFISFGVALGVMACHRGVGARSKEPSSAKEGAAKRLIRNRFKEIIDNWQYNLFMLLP